MPQPHRQLRYAALALALSSLLVGCDNNEYFITQPAGGGIGSGGNSGTGSADGSFSYSDLRGDLLSGSASAGAPDILTVSGRFDSQQLAIDVTFAAPIVPWTLDAENSLDGFLDLDIDGDASTGVASAVDDFGGDTGLGVEYYLALRSADGTSVALVNPASKATVLVPATILESTLSIRIDRSVLRGTTGREVRFALVAGNPTSPATDFAPNRGYWSIPVP